MEASHAGPTEEPVTALLQRIQEGDRDALDRLFPLVYAELRRVAQRQLRREGPGHTLDATGLVHEAYLKMAGQAVADARGRSHFVAIGARAMRQVLVDHARRRRAAKRGGEWARTSITGKALPAELDLDGLLALDQALERLDERQRRVVECRFFGGLDEQETAEAVGVSLRTVQRDWLRARAWIYQELYPRPG